MNFNFLCALFYIKTKSECVTPKKKEIMEKTSVDSLKIYTHTHEGTHTHIDEKMSSNVIQVMSWAKVAKKSVSEHESLHITSLTYTHTYTHGPKRVFIGIMFG